MDLNFRKEAFSLAYVNAVASVAGYATGKPSCDEDSVDLTCYVRGGKGTVRSPKLDIQLKCTAEAPNGNPIPFKLRYKNYEELRHNNYQTPRILVVVFVPEEIGDWLLQTPQQMVLRNCGYWVSLCGLPKSIYSEESKVPIDIPAGQIFDVSGLSGMMDRIGQGGLP